MATITVSSDLDVVTKYNALVKQSLGVDSAYIRAKETIQELMEDGAIDEAQKAEIISSIVGGVINNINSSSLSAAISWVNAEKEIEFKKLELAKQLDIMDQDILTKEAQTAQILSATRLAKVESKRVYGTAVFDSLGNITTIDNTGKVAKDIELLETSISKATSEVGLVDQKVKESQAAVHKIIADTYVNYGNYSYSGLGDGGITTVTANHGSYKTLSDTQQDIAVEQAKGYAYNAWANALTGSASMLGTAIASEYAEFGTDQPGGILLETVLDTARNLKAATTTSSDAIPTY